jgi:hypothetical protein
MSTRVPFQERESKLDAAGADAQEDLRRLKTQHFDSPRCATWLCLRLQARGSSARSGTQTAGTSVRLLTQK